MMTLTLIWICFGETRASSLTWVHYQVRHLGRKYNICLLVMSIEMMSRNFNNKEQTFIMCDSVL